MGHMRSYGSYNKEQENKKPAFACATADKLETRNK
jgi:hypothetical protein